MDERDRYGGIRSVKGDSTGYFRVDRIADRSWFITPEGNGFLSVGVNHVDYREDGSPEFVRFVCSHLSDWGFNTIGWSQESISPGFVKGSVVHSQGWGPEQYKHADLPFTHLLRFTDMEWYVDEVYPNVFDAAFADRCDNVARECCTQLHDDPKLIGYFYADTPNWPGWAGHEGYDLQKSPDRQQFQSLVAQYYRVIHDAIRRYDTDHLLLGDRYKGNRVIPVGDEVTHGLPDCVLQAARETVDVLSIEYFARFETMREELHYWNSVFGKPILLADSAFLAPTDALSVSPDSEIYVRDQTARGAAYQEFAREAFSHPWIVGWHWCAFGRSKGRKSGLLDGEDKPYEACVNLMRAFNTDQLSAIGSAARGCR